MSNVPLYDSVVRDLGYDPLAGTWPPPRKPRRPKPKGKP